MASCDLHHLLPELSIISKETSCPFPQPKVACICCPSVFALSYVFQVNRSIHYRHQYAFAAAWKLKP